MRDYSKQEVLDIVEAAAKKHGIPRDDFLRFTAIETGFTYNERAVNPSSGAKGLFQFLPGTASQYGIAGRELDPVANADAGARLFNDNKRDIIASSERSGRPLLSGESQPNGFDLYMAHQQGPYGYRSIQAALDPKFDRFFNDTPTRGNILANIGNDIDELTGVRKEQLRGMSDRDLAKTFVQYWETKYERIAIPEKGVEPLAGGQTQNRPGQPATTPRPADPMADGVLEKGEKGEAVRKLQEALNNAGARDAKGNKLTPDSDYGDRTKEAVENYQRSRGLKVDGEAGPDTLKALRENKPAVQQTEPTTPGAPSNPTSPSAPNVPSNFNASNFLKQQTPEVRAYLDLVAWKEVHQSLNADGSPSGYRERNGVPGSRGLMPESAIADNGKLPTDELRYNVGRYQMKNVDVEHMRKAYDSKIDDFSPESQDRIAVAKMKYRGVMQELQEGDIRGAIKKGGQEWASLPGSPYGQVQKGYTVDQAVDYYNQRLAFHKALDKGGQTQSPAQPDTPSNKPTVPAGQNGAMKDGVLEKGEKGEDVRKLQEALNNAGARDAKGNKLTPDSDYGDRTKEAVENYQRSRGLKVDGEAGPDTLKALRENKPPVQQNEPTTPGAPTTPTTKSSGWPTPGNYTINLPDKPREGHGEFGTPRSSGNPHAGIDINGKVGDPIQSVGPGKVIEAGYKNNVAGNVVIIQHDDGTRSRYLHLDTIQVKKGDRVDADTQIATMGRTGNTPGDTHLHFEMYDKSGKLTDPRKFFHFQGERSEVVGEIQAKLKELGFKGPDGKELVADKDFGSRTTHAVREFQKANGIEATGVVDPNTLNALRQAKAQTQSADNGEAPRAKQENTPATVNAALGKNANSSGDPEARLAYGDRLPPEVLAMWKERDKNNPISKMLEEGMAKLDAERNGSLNATPSDKISDLRMRMLYDQTLELTKTLPAGTFKNPEEQQRAAGVIAAELAVAGKFNPQSMALDKNGAGYVFVFEGKDASKAAASGERPEPVNLNAAKNQPFEVSVQMMADQSLKLAPPLLIAQTASHQPMQTNPVQSNPEMDKTQEQAKPKIA
jgi:peptidoglycan hydrolase-like protein with peptidoglycan-binding domain